MSVKNAIKYSKMHGFLTAHKLGTADRCVNINKLGDLKKKNILP